MLYDPLPSTPASTQRLNLCSQPVSMSRLSILENPSHLKLPEVGTNMFLTPWRTTPGKDIGSTWDTLTSPSRTQDQVRLHGLLIAEEFGQHFLEQT